MEIGGNGFVSAFSGLIFGAVAKHHREAIGFTEDASLFASFLVWAVFGASFAGPVLTGGRRVRDRLRGAQPDPGSHAARRGRPRGGFAAKTVAFMGWFGLGAWPPWCSLLALEELRGSAVDTPLFEIATWTILLSVVLHGLTARPLAAAYGASVRASDPSAAELVRLAEPRLRRHLFRPTDVAAGRPEVVAARGEERQPASLRRCRYTVGRPTAGPSVSRQIHPGRMMRFRDTRP